MGRRRKTNHAFEHFHGDRIKPIRKMRYGTADEALDLVKKTPDGHFLNRNEDPQLQLLWVLLERVAQEKEDQFKNRQLDIFADNSKLLKTEDAKINGKKKLTFAKVFTRAVNKVKYTTSNREHGADLLLGMANDAELFLSDRKANKGPLIKDQIEEMRNAANKLYEQQHLSQKFGKNKLIIKKITKTNTHNEQYCDDGESLSADHVRTWKRRGSSPNLS